MKKAIVSAMFLAVLLSTAGVYAVDPKPATPVATVTEVPKAPEVPKAVETPKDAAKPADVAVPAADAAKPETNPPDISKIEKEDPTTFVDKIKTAYAAKEWGILVGFVLMMLVFLVVKFFWKAFPPKWIPYMSIAFGVLGDVGWQLAIGGQVWWRAILAGLTSGVTATGMWELVGKKLFGSVTDKQEATAKK